MTQSQLIQFFEPELPGVTVEFRLETRVHPDDSSRMIVQSFVKEAGRDWRMIGRYTTTRKSLSEKEAQGIIQTEWEFDL